MRLLSSAVGLIVLSVTLSATDREDAAILARAWAAVAAGQTAEAVSLADGLLARRPRHHDAVAVKIAALVEAGQTAAALDAYERRQTLVRHEDPYLLEPIALSVLRDLARASDPGLRIEAAGRLAEAGDPRGREILSGAGPAAAATLAGLGDPASLETVHARAVAPDTFDRSRIAAELGRIGNPASADILRRFLTDPSPATRAAAAEALGRLKSPEAIPDLKKALEDERFVVRAQAAAALAKLGDPSGAPVLQSMAVNEGSEVRLMAAEGLRDLGDPSWISLVTPLLESPESLTRVRAAALVAAIDPEAAGRVFAGAAQDPNPVIRGEAGRILADLAGTDVTVLRRMLRDADPWVRLRAAGGLIHQAGA
jgi:HEAT repeat protein